MKVELLLFFFLALITTSCANMGHFKYIMKPEVVNKDDLEDQAYELTPKHKFKVVTSESLSEQRPEIIITVDTLFTDYSDCMNVTDNGDGVRKFLIAVVTSTFTCNYHYGKCNGEYDSQNELIVVSYKAFKRRGTLPLLQHEWDHAYGTLKSDHSNIRSIIQCIKY